MKVRIASTLLLIGVITAALLSEPSGQDAALPEPVCEPVHTIAQNVPSCEPTPYISVAEPTPAELSVSTVQPISVVSEKNTPMDVAFTLNIRHSNIRVGYETSEEALEQRPGWLNTSAYPGTPGVCVVYGHRNRRHLRALEKLELGDAVTVTISAEKVLTYIVTDIRVVDELADIVLSSTEIPTLVLVTCYPFRYTGNAPQKYVVTAVVRGERP